MPKLFMHALTTAFTAIMLSASPCVLAATTSEDPHDPSNQSDDMNTDIRAEPQLDTGSPNPKSVGRTGRARPGATDPATNLQSDGTSTNITGRTSAAPGTTDPATNLSNGTDIRGNTTSDPNAGSSDISDRLDRANTDTRTRNNRLDGSSNPASNVPPGSSTRSNSGAPPSGSSSTTGAGTSSSSSTSGTGNAGSTSSGSAAGGGAR